MQPSVLATKIYVPPLRPHSISRPRLTTRLRDSTGYDLVLVSAPAGFGKTTLLTEWARANRPAATAWLSVDEGDNDPVRFWDHFIAAVAPLGSDAGREASGLLHSPVPLPPESFLTALVNGLAGVDEDFALVLDDYHFIESPVIHSAIAFLIDHIPPRMQLVIAGRSDPPLPLARYRGHGSLLEIGADDLRFTLDEAASLLGELSGAPTAPEHVAALNKRTEGWAVGLKLAALSMQEAEEVGAFISSFTGSNRFIMDYLMEEVLQRQREEVRHFLLDTCLLDTFTASLCDAVTGRTDGETVLRGLKLANLFVIPLDDSRTWYRYEHLFADLLRHQLERSRTAEEIAQLHRRAGLWYESHDLPREAIDHSLAAQDWEKALDLLTIESLREEQTGEVVTLLGWLRALPRDVLRQRPRLQMSYASAFTFTGQLEAAEEVLDDLEKNGPVSDEMRGRVAAGRAVIAVIRGEEAEAMRLSQTALRLLPPGEILYRAMLSLNVASMYFMRGPFQETEALFNEARELGRQVQNQWIEALASVFLSYIELLRGRLGRAIARAQEDIALLGNSPAAAHAHGFLAGFLYERNELDSALAHLDRGAELAQRMTVRPVDWETSYNLRMQVKLAQGDQAAAQEAMEQIDLWVSRDHSEAAGGRHAGYHLALALRQRDEKEASRWGDALAAHQDLLRWSDSLLLVPLLILQGRKEQVEAQIHAFYDSLAIEYLSSEWPYWRMKVRMWQALAAPSWAEARDLLAEALTLARPERCIRTFVDEGPSVIPYLRKAISEGIEPQFAATLLTTIEAEERVARAEKASRRATDAPAILSERELEILRLVATGMSNREIARTLFITAGTVKVHLYNISEKLNTTGRAKAVIQARELHLI